MPRHYVDVVPLAVSRADRYTYRSDHPLPAGALVSVPYGRRKIRGVVTGPAAARGDAKPVAEVTGVVLDGRLRGLAEWIAEQYVSPLGLAYSLVAPEAVEGRLDPVAGPAPGPGFSERLLVAADRAPHYASELAALPDRQHLIVVPAAGVIPELARRIGQATTPYHSRLTPKQRAAVWNRVGSGEPGLVVGTRSAIFLPWRNLGLVAVEDEDDIAHKHDRTPSYHARPAAWRLAELSAARLHLGSAAPSLEAWQASAHREEVWRPASLRIIDHSREDALIGTLAGRAIDEVLAEGRKVAMYAPSRLRPALRRELGRRSISLLAGAPPPGRFDLIVTAGVDRLLALPDFRAAEAAQAILRKLAAGLTDGGRLLVQTAVPDHPAIANLTAPYTRFVQAERRDRRALRLPPFVRLTRVGGAADLGTVERLTERLRRLVPTRDIRTVPIGTRRQVLVSGDPARLRPLLTDGWRLDVDPVALPRLR